MVGELEWFKQNIKIYGCNCIFDYFHQVSFHRGNSCQKLHTGFIGLFHEQDRVVDLKYAAETNILFTNEYHYLISLAAKDLDQNLIHEYHFHVA